jgi:hypothetical protein
VCTRRGGAVAAEEILDQIQKSKTTLGRSQDKRSTVSRKHGLTAIYFNLSSNPAMTGQTADPKEFEALMAKCVELSFFIVLALPL